MTHIVFDDYPRNGEGVTLTDVDPGYAPDGAELRVYTGVCGDGYLNHDDIVRLVCELSAHLADT